MATRATKVRAKKKLGRAAEKKAEQLIDGALLLQTEAQRGVRMQLLDLAFHTHENHSHTDDDLIQTAAKFARFIETGKAPKANVTELTTFTKGE